MLIAVRQPREVREAATSVQLRDGRTRRVEGPACGGVDRHGLHLQTRVLQVTDSLQQKAGNYSNGNRFLRVKTSKPWSAAE